MLSLKVQLFRCQRRIWGPTPHGSSNFALLDLGCSVFCKHESRVRFSGGAPIFSRAPDVQHRLLILASSVRLAGGGPISRGRWTGPGIPNPRDASSNLARESKNAEVTGIGIPTGLKIQCFSVRGRASVPSRRSPTGRGRGFKTLSVLVRIQPSVPRFSS